MNATKHTSGPWKADSHDGRSTIIISGQWGEIARVSDVFDAVQQGANGDLIAAAPELLEALEGILAVANVRIDDPRISAFDAARAAIAKAKGQA